MSAEDRDFLVDHGQWPRTSSGTPYCAVKRYPPGGGFPYEFGVVVWHPDHGYGLFRRMLGGDLEKTPQLTTVDALLEDRWLVD